MWKKNCCSICFWFPLSSFSIKITPSFPCRFLAAFLLWIVIFHAAPRRYVFHRVFPAQLCVACVVSWTLEASLGHVCLSLGDNWREGRTAHAATASVSCKFAMEDLCLPCTKASDSKILDRTVHIYRQCFTEKLRWSRVSGYLLQTAQSWANTGVTEDGHCQGACHPQWFFYVPNWDGTDINVILRFTRDTQSPMLRAIFLYHNWWFIKHVCIE